MLLKGQRRAMKDLRKPSSILIVRQILVI